MDNLPPGGIRAPRIAPSLAAPRPSGPYESQPKHIASLTDRGELKQLTQGEAGQEVVSTTSSSLTTTDQQATFPLTTGPGLSTNYLTNPVTADVLKDVIFIMSTDESDSEWRAPHYNAFLLDTQQASQGIGCSGRYGCWIIGDSAPSHASSLQVGYAKAGGFYEGGDGPGTATERVIRFLSGLINLPSRSFIIRLCCLPCEEVRDAARASRQAGYHLQWVDTELQDLTVVPEVLRNFITDRVRVQDIFRTILAALSPDSSAPLLPAYFRSFLEKVIDENNVGSFDPEILRKDDAPLFRYTVGRTLGYLKVHLHGTNHHFTRKTVKEALGEKYGVLAASMLEAAATDNLVGFVGEHIIDNGLLNLLSIDVRVNGLAGMHREAYPFAV